MSLNAGVLSLRLIPIDSCEKMLSELMAGVTLVDPLLATSGVSYGILLFLLTISILEMADFAVRRTFPLFPSVTVNRGMYFKPAPGQTRETI